MDSSGEVRLRRVEGYDGAPVLAVQLLASSDANRVEADTDIANRPEQRALERAGFRREGVCRGAQWRAGAWHDSVLYSLVRSDL